MAGEIKVGGKQTKKKDKDGCLRSHFKSPWNICTVFTPVPTREMDRFCPFCVRLEDLLSLLLLQVEE